VAVDANRIAAFPDFVNLPAEELKEFAGAMSETEVDAGGVVIRIDEYGTAIYLIEAGNADVRDDSGDVIKALGPGDAFGEIDNPADGGGRRAHAVAAAVPFGAGLRANPTTRT
jgi:signal-transduction protein with cAMP-binding, CBS, and nucleotidyltransferase domain